MSDDGRTSARETEIRERFADGWYDDDTDASRDVRCLLAALNAREAESTTLREIVALLLDAAEAEAGPRWYSARAREKLAALR